HRGCQSCQLRCHALRDTVNDGVPRNIDVLGKAAPQMGRDLSRGIAIADGVGVVTPVGVFAMTVLAQITPLALATGDVVLQKHQVSFLESFASGELFAGL